MSSKTEASDQYKNLEDIIENFSYQSFHKQDNLGRVSMLIQTAVSALRNPYDGNLIAQTGDLSGTKALRAIRAKMQNDKVGRQILAEKPRVNEETVNFQNFKDYPKNSFGYHYWVWMSNYEFSPDERPKAKYIPDIELAYVMQRYKENHDFLHTLLNLNIEIESELAVKWYEMVQTGIPMTALASFVGPLRLGLGANRKLFFEMLPLILRNANRSKFFMNVYFEKEFERDVDEFRDELGIIPFSS